MEIKATQNSIHQEYNQNQKLAESNLSQNSYLENKSSFFSCERQKIDLNFENSFSGQEFFGSTSLQIIPLVDSLKEISLDIM